MDDSSFPWGARHDGEITFTESALPRDDSLAEIAPWAAPSSSASQETASLSSSTRRRLGLSSKSWRKDPNHLPKYGGRGETDDYGNGVYDQNLQKAGKNSFIQFIKKKASRPAFAPRDEGTSFVTSTNSSLDGPSSYAGLSGVAGTTKPHNQASTSTSNTSLLIPPLTRRTRKASSKNKGMLTPPSSAILEDPFARLDVSNMDMEGIVDTSRINIETSPVDGVLLRDHWGVPPALASQGPGVINGNYTLGGPSRTSPSASPSLTVSLPSPFSNPDPFRAASSRPPLRNGKAWALPSLSISPKEVPPHSIPNPPNDHTLETGPLEAPGYMVGSETSPSSPSQSSFSFHPPSNAVTPTTTSPNWVAPDSWAIQKRPREASSARGRTPGGSMLGVDGIYRSRPSTLASISGPNGTGTSSYQLDPGEEEMSDDDDDVRGPDIFGSSHNLTTHRKPSWTGENAIRDPDGKGLGGGLARSVERGKVSRRSSSQHFPGGRGRDKSLPQTPMTGSSEVTLRKNVQASVRIYRADTKYHVVSCPPATTVAEMKGALTKKLGIKGDTHRLYMQEKGRQRALGPNQSPAMILHRRLEQAGYAPSDDLETLGGEDLGFLIRFIFRNASLGIVEIDDDAFPHGFEHVELSERGLETVPIVLYRHAESIVTLNLSKNALVDLPHDFVTNCLALRELRLTNVSMKRLPRAVRHLKSLQWLDISSNRIPELDHAGLEAIVGLRQILAQNNRLSNLPSSFAHMLSLKYLNISNNKFEQVPPVLCDMPNLVDLDISFNSISILPAEIGRLIALERLIIVGNQIDQFPPEVSRMISLRELDCRRNLISDLTPLSSLPRLESLLAEHNAIHILNFVIGPRLLTFNASNNRTAKSVLRPLVTGPASPAFALTTLDLSHLRLSSFDEEGAAALGAFKALITLKLDYNDFRSIPDIICTLTEIETLSATNNDLHNLPEEIGRLRKLRTFTVHNNNIKVVPESIWQCESLVELNMSSNSLDVWKDPATAPAPGLGAALESITDGVRNGSELTLAMERKASSVGTITMRTVPPLAYSLRRLLIADNYLGVANRTSTFDIFHTLSLMRELRVLNLSFNQITELPTTHLQAFANLHELYLSGNNLTSIPGESLQKISKLKVLHLNGNKLQTLPAELGKVVGLETLDVGNNLLKYNVANWQYDWNWNFNSQLKFLNLSGNKRLEIKNQQPNLPSGGASATPQLFDFANLMKLRVLGLMDVTIRGASMPEESVERRVRTSDTEINGMAYGIADTLGVVDGPMTFDFALPKFRGRENECIFGMFGRTRPNLSGNRAAKYLQEQFPRVFTEALAKSLDKNGPNLAEDVPESLRNAFLTLNRNLYEHLVMRGHNEQAGPTRKLSTISMSGPVGNDLRGGASGIVIYIIDRPQTKTMYVANVGDMLAVVSHSNGGFSPVSIKHDPFERTEIIRIRAAEGWVSPKGMVNEEEDLSRNFGLYHLLPAVNARPDIFTHILSEFDQFVIIGNRGLWDFVSYRTAVDIARLNREDPMKAAQMLRDYAMAYGADGNTVVMVVAVEDLFPNNGRSRMPNPDTDPFAYTTRRGPRPERDRLLRMLDESITPPRGSLALVFTDIRNSTSLWEKNVGMPLAMRVHNELLRRQARWIGGYEVKTEGDSFMLAFQTMPAALLWCFTVQTELLVADWPMEIIESEEGGEKLDSNGNTTARGLSVRMGVHWGRPVCAEDPTTHRMDYFGPMVNRSARVMSQALGGQIMASSDAIREIQATLGERYDENSPSLPHVETLKRMGIEIVNIGERSLKGLEAPEDLSLVLPTSLLGRLEAPTAPVPEASSRIHFNIDQLKELNVLTLRLEALATSRIFEPARPGTQPLLASAPSNDRSSVPNALGPKAAVLRANLDVVLSNFKADAPDHDLMLLLDQITGRIENSLSTLYLRTMMHGSDRTRSRAGPPPHLEDIDPRILREAVRLVQNLLLPATTR